MGDWAVILKYYISSFVVSEMQLAKVQYCVTWITFENCYNQVPTFVVTHGMWIDRRLETETRDCGTSSDGRITPAPLVTQNECCMIRTSPQITPPLGPYIPHQIASTPMIRDMCALAVTCTPDPGARVARHVRNSHNLAVRAQPMFAHKLLVSTGARLCPKFWISQFQIGKRPNASENINNTRSPLVFSLFTRIRFCPDKKRKPSHQPTCHSLMTVSMNVVSHICKLQFH